VDENSAPSIAEQVLPRFVNEGGWKTQFILFSGADGQSSNGNERFYNEQGLPVNFDLH
jgi:hypothetical protein